MGKEAKMAREEQEQPVLLDRAGTGETHLSSSNRDSGQESSANSKGLEGSKGSNSEEESQGNAKNKGRGRKRGRKPGHSYTFRGAVEEIKRRNRASGRSAKELGIEWPEDYCYDSPRTRAHYFKGRNTVAGGTIFQCTHCGKVKWLPDGVADCQRFSAMIKIYGLQAAYNRLLDEHSQAKSLLSKIQDIRFLQKIMPEEEFPIALAAVMLDREYPYDPEMTEEEVL